MFRRTDGIEKNRPQSANNPGPPHVALFRRAVILSRRRRICGCFSSIHSIQRPDHVHSLNQRDLLCSSPALQFLLASDGPRNLLVSFEPHESIAVVLRGEAVVLFPFMLKHTFVKVAGDTDVERVAAARHDVCEIAVFVHRCHPNLLAAALAVTGRTTADPSPAAQDDSVEEGVWPGRLPG